MWTHFLHLLWRSLVYFPSELSGNWLSVLLPPILFAVDIAVEGFSAGRNGWPSVKERILKRNGWLLASAYLLLVGWAIVHTVYQDHEALVEANRKFKLASQDADIHGEVTEIYTVNQGKNTSFAVATLELYNPAGVPTTLSDWRMQVILGSGEISAESPFFPAADMRIPIKGADQKMVLLKDKFCVTALEQPLNTGDARMCWFWGAFPRQANPKFIPPVVVSFLNVRSGKRQSIDSRKFSLTTGQIVRPNS